MCSDTPTDGKSVFPSSLIIKVLVFGAHHRAMNGNRLNSLLCFILRQRKQAREKRVKWAIWEKKCLIETFYAISVVNELQWFIPDKGTLTNILMLSQLSH